MVIMRERLRHLFRRNRRKRYTEAPPHEEEPPPAEEAPKKENQTEIIPPPAVEGEMATYFHVGLMAKMCLIHGYKNGIWKLQTTSKTESDFYLSTFGEGYPGITSVYGGMEAYKEVGNYHSSFSWLTDREFLSDLGAHGEGLGGLWHSVLKSALATAEEFQFSSKLKCGFERNPWKVELEVPIYKQPHFMGYLLVAPAENFLLGYRTVFNVEDRNFAMHGFCLGYDNKTTEVALKLENFELLRGSIFQRFGEKWALALKANLYGDMEPKRYTIGGQYEWEPGTLLKAKIRGDTRLGFIYQRKIREDIEVLLHCNFLGRDPLNGEHRVGASWYFNL